MVNPTYSKIVGTGSYLPKRIVTNADMAKKVDTSDAWIVERTGIHTRHMATPPEENTTTMAVHAAKAALQAADLPKDVVDLIIVSTTTPDCPFPSTASTLQHELGISNCCPAFDISAACSGFIYALHLADNLIRSGSVKAALLVGSETLTRLVDWQDRATCVLFGDGAGAVLLHADNMPGVYSSHIHAAGQYRSLLYTEKRTNPEQSFYIKMQGKEVFKVAVNTLQDMANQVLKEHQRDIDAIDWFIPHQANIRIIQAIAKKLSIPNERIVLTLDTQGNTSAASIPLALDAAIKDGRVKTYDLLLLEAFGAGFTWGSTLVRY